MAIVEIEEQLNKSEEMADMMLFLLNEDRIPVPSLSIPELLMAKIRPGLSAEILTSTIISRFEEIGIPSGPLLNGHTNVMEQYTKVIMEEIVSAIQNDMRIDVATDPGASVTATGANAGGPLTAVGATVAPHTGTGVAR